MGREEADEDLRIQFEREGPGLDAAEYGLTFEKSGEFGTGGSAAPSNVKEAKSSDSLVTIRVATVKRSKTTPDPSNSASNALKNVDGELRNISVSTS